MAQERVTLTETELLQALAEALQREPDPTDAWTTEEIRKAAGWGISKANRVIRELVDSGKWECVQAPRRNRTGVVTPTWAYRPVRVPVE